MNGEKREKGVHMETNVLYLDLVCFTKLPLNESLCCICIYFYYNTTEVIHSILFIFKCPYNINYVFVIYREAQP